MSLNEPRITRPPATGVSPVVVVLLALGPPLGAHAVAMSTAAAAMPSSVRCVRCCVMPLGGSFPNARSFGSLGKARRYGRTPPAIPPYGRGRSDDQRVDFRADLLRLPATRVETAARGRVDRRRDIARQDDPLALRFDSRIRDRHR